MEAVDASHTDCDSAHAHVGCKETRCRIKLILKLRSRFLQEDFASEAAGVQHAGIISVSVRGYQGPPGASRAGPLSRTPHAYES